MARVELDDSWLVRGDAESVQRRLRKFLNQQRSRIVEDSDGEIQFQQGSWLLTRLLGGWFVPASWLPRKGTIRIKKTKTGLRIRATIEESVGFGFLDPILKGKYEKFFESWMDELRDLFDEDG